MSFLNYSTREVIFKIIYYGPAESGKSENIKAIYKKAKADDRGKLVSMVTKTGKPMFYEFFSIDLGTIKGCKVKFHLYSVVGQIYNRTTRKLIMKGVDGIIFVADSLGERFEANIESFKEMLKFLKEYNIDFITLPYVLQPLLRI